MSKKLKLLYIEDDPANREGLVSVLSDESVCDYNIEVDAVDTFDGSLEKIQNEKYHIIILDIYKGKPNNNVEAGIDILEKLQKICFVPIIFFSGNTINVQDLKSQIVGVVKKGDDGIEGLKKEIERLVKFNLPFVKENIYNHLEEEFRKYFWDIIHKERNIFKHDKADFSLGYLMLRRLSNSLSKEKIYKILGDRTLEKDKIHPMEFYLYPTDATTEFESGEILKKGDDVYIILTPSCDFIERFDKNGKSLGRKVGKILLAKTILLTNTDEYQCYFNTKKEDGSEKSNKEKESDKKNLARLIKSSRSDRYFFLPQTPFIENRIIDFQIKEIVDYENLIKDFTRLATLDNPFAQAMIASFIRYYNRIGYPDIDSDLIIKAL